MGSKESGEPPDMEAAEENGPLLEALTEVAKKRMLGKPSGKVAGAVKKAKKRQQEAKKEREHDLENSDCEYESQEDQSAAEIHRKRQKVTFEGLFLLCGMDSMVCTWIKDAKVEAKQKPKSSPAEDIRQYNAVHTQIKGALARLAQRFTGTAVHELYTVILGSMTMESAPLASGTIEPCFIGGAGLVADVGVVFTLKNAKKQKTPPFALSSQYLPFVRHVYFLSHIDDVIRSTVYTWVKTQTWPKGSSVVDKLQACSADGTIRERMFSQFEESMEYVGKAAEA